MLFRSKFSVGARYQPWLQHEFSLSTYIVDYSDESYTQYLGRKQNYRDLPGFVKQNDFVTRLTYSYTF